MSQRQYPDSPSSIISHTSASANESSSSPQQNLSAALVTQLLPDESLQEHLNSLLEAQYNTIESLKASLGDVVRFNQEMSPSYAKTQKESTSEAPEQPQKKHPMVALSSDLDICSKWVSEIQSDLNYVHDKVRHLQEKLEGRIKSNVEEESS